MAINLQNTISFDLGTAVTARLEAFKKSRSDLQVRDEISFLQQVADKGLSYAEQLAFRQAQLEREDKRTVPDQDYIKSLKKEIQDVTKLARYEKVRADYKSSLNDVTTGKKSYESHLQFLNSQLDNVSDPDLKTEIQGQIYDTQTKIQQADLDLIQNEITMALSDKSLDILNTAIDAVKKQKATALGAGDTRLAQAWDLKLQSMEQSKISIGVENKVNQLVSLKSRQASATDYLTDLSDMISGASTSTPVTIDGVRYGSEQEFWTQQRDKYISTNFFSDVTKEYSDYIEGIGSKLGQVSNTILNNIQTQFATLASRPELAPFATRLETAKTAALSNAVAYNANAILNQYAVDNDYAKATTALEQLQKTYGIDQTTNLQKVVLDEAKAKGDLYGNILSTVNAGVASGLSFSQAVNEVFSSINANKGEILSPTVSPEKLVTTPTQSLINEAPATTKAQVQPTTTTLPTTPSLPKVSDVIGRRASTVNPTVTEYFRKDTGAGFGDPVPLFSYLGSKGYTDITDFGKLNPLLDKGL
jgi:hypothetical protein